MNDDLNDLMYFIYFLWKEIFIRFLELIESKKFWIGIITGSAITYFIA
jgi:hypothetical protein